MGRGSYLGGSTVIGPKSSWFSRKKPAKEKASSDSEIVKAPRVKQKLPSQLSSTSNSENIHHKKSELKRKSKQKNYQAKKAACKRDKDKRGQSIEHTAPRAEEIEAIKILSVSVGLNPDAFSPINPISHFHPKITQLSEEKKLQISQHANNVRLDEDRKREKRRKAHRLLKGTGLKEKL